LLWLTLGAQAGGSITILQYPKIVYLRKEKVLLDRDLAEMYSVETKQLKRAVRRNISRFPEDFMFELSKEEYQLLRSQSGTLKRGTHSNYAPISPFQF
jgi:hypothetical protein